MKRGASPQELAVERARELSQATQASARRYVASQALDHDDCRELLQMLGLLPDNEPAPHTSTAHAAVDHQHTHHAAQEART